MLLSHKGFRARIAALRIGKLSVSTVVGLLAMAAFAAAQSQPPKPPASTNSTKPPPAPAPQNPQQPPQQNPPPPPPPNGNFSVPIAGLSSADLARFQHGAQVFGETETVADGLGPVFNRDSCRACHNAGGPGGGNSTIFGVRFGKLTNGKFDPLINLGGPVLQTQGITGRNGQKIPSEVVPKEATIVARRRTTPTFGLGFVDAVPDAYFQGLAATQLATTPETAGRVNLVTDLRTGRKVVGKFGWKAASPNLFHFAGDAYKEEMGITSPGWLRDSDGRLIDEENPPQGNAALLKFNPVFSPNEDDLDDVEAFADFMSLLAAPPRGPINATVTAGQEVFLDIGCADCHNTTMMTGTNAVPQLSLKSFAPYSDFLLHDMGSLGDGVSQGMATGREMRTAPLWGLRLHTRFLHDGRASSIEDAINQHQGQGAAARTRFQQLNSTDRAAIVAFLKSL